MSVPIVPRRSARLHKPKTCDSCATCDRIKDKLDVRLLGTDTQFLSIHLSKPNSTTVVFDQSVQIGQMHIMYVATVNRPHVACAIGKLSQRCANPTLSDWKAVFCNSDFAGSTVDRKFRSGYVFILAGGAISWLSKKQPIIAQSTCEAEFVAMQEAARETVDFLIVKGVGSICHIKAMGLVETMIKGEY
ncbi:uncharacterized mitochondrial protein AtMg00810-like [Bombus impatiens]|uniref:Uncharacterized mitochondrial protein AtMg00810-like n=1 Tax=Bombus impatiens TaxID=132113 RepID=A0A6P6FI03_BOMIM|nr:uncharacterized mitochondrial protein AtMg00810-like [Bombus impatiens]